MPRKKKSKNKSNARSLALAEASKSTEAATDAVVSPPPVPKEVVMECTQSLDDTGADDEAAAFLAAMGGGGKKKKKKKKSKNVVTEENVNDNSVNSTVAAETTKVDDASNIDEAAAFLGAMGGGSKKKKKKKKKKSVAAAEVTGTTNDKADDDKKKPKKLSAAARAAQQARLRREEEEKRIAEAARVEAEAQAAFEAKEASIAEKKRLARQKKKEAKKRREEQAKKDGTYMTAKQREAAERKRAAMARFGVSVAENDKDVENGVKARKQAERARKEAYKKEKARKKAEAEAAEKAKAELAAKAEADAKAAAAAAAVSTEKEESDGGNWDDSDAEVDDWDADDALENIVVPNQNAWDDQEDLAIAEKREAEKREAAAMKKKREQMAKQSNTKKQFGKKASNKKQTKKELKMEKRRLARKKAAAAARGAAGSDSYSDESDEDGVSHAKDKDHVHKMRESKARRQKMYREAMMKRTDSDLRSPVVCVMGHVDTGKTKLLDKIRRTNVQDGEAGGITQQIGATFFPIDAIARKTSKLMEDFNLDLRVPGLLMIDTPGHESFTNLRTRGSSVCDLAILVVDIMHGLEPQTIESLNLLRKGKTPFIVALNKVDRCYGWEPIPDSPIRDTLGEQKEYTITEFRQRVDGVKTEFMEQGLNAELYFENKDMAHTISLVPTSAHSGEGVCDLLLLLIQIAQTMMAKRIMYTPFVQCQVLEVKVIEGLGTTVDVILINGELRQGDTIVLCGLNGPIVTQIRALLTPKGMKDMRIKGDYQTHSVIKGALGIKLAAQGVEKVVAGTALQVLSPEDYPEHIKEEVMEPLSNFNSLLQKSGRGVFVQASTIGSLEALLEFLRTLDVPIPVAGFNIGPVHKKDVMAASVMLSHQREYATILAFDVPITPEITEMSKEMGVKIFSADIIYHLFDQFTAYMDKIVSDRKASAKNLAYFPVKLQILPQHIFNAKNPIVFGVRVEAGILKVGTPICIVKTRTGELAEGQSSKSVLSIGHIASIENNNKTVAMASPGDEVCIKIEQNMDQNYIQYGRQFNSTDILYSKLSRGSIDLLKENFKDDLKKEDWMLVVQIKKLLDIM